MTGNKAWKKIWSNVNWWNYWGTFFNFFRDIRTTLCDPIGGSPPGCPVPGILQARALEWVAISFSNAWKWKVKVKLLSRAWLLGPHGLQPTRLLRPRDFPGKSTGVGCHCLLRTLYRFLTKYNLKRKINSRISPLKPLVLQISKNVNPGRTKVFIL